MKVNIEQYDVFEQMHWTCFHFVYENESYDPDGPCNDPSCPWNRVNENYIEPYKAMIKFLEIYYSRTKSDDIGSILSDLQILVDGNSADPASLLEWKTCLDNIRLKKFY